MFPIASGQATSLVAESATQAAALAFDGVADQLLVQDPASFRAYPLDVVNTFTVEAWVYPTAPHQVDAQSNNSTAS